MLGLQWASQLFSLRIKLWLLWRETDNCKFLGISLNTELKNMDDQDCPEVQDLLEVEKWVFAPVTNSDTRPNFSVRNARQNWLTTGQFRLWSCKFRIVKRFFSIYVSKPRKTKQSFPRFTQEYLSICAVCLIAKILLISAKRSWVTQSWRITAVLFGKTLFQICDCLFFRTVCTFNDCFWLLWEKSSLKNMWGINCLGGKFL